MTIVHFVAGNSFGGVEGHICTLIKLMKESDFRFKIVCDQSVQQDFKMRLAGLDAEILPLKLCPQPSLKSYFKLIKTFRRIAPDVVHCHLYSASRLGAMAAKIAGVKKVIETIHIEEVWRSGFKKQLFCTVDAVVGRLFLDHYIAVSAAVASYYKKNKSVPDHKITLIHNTTEHEGGDVRQKSFSFRIGFMGRLVDQKGVDVLLNAVNIIRKREVSCHLFIAGNGPLKTQLEQQVSRLGISESVTFLGNVSNKEKFFEMIDIFVLPSRYEGFPLVLLEAGMYQMPVVATEVSGTPEIIRPNKTGLLVPKDDAENLALAILELKNADKRELYSKNLNKLVGSEFSKEIYTQKMEDFYKKLIS